MKKPTPTKPKYKVIALFALALLATRFGLGSAFSSASDITTTSVSTAVNNERTQRNIAALVPNGKLAAAAQFKANDMINRKYFSHTDPEGHYIWDKIIAEGYTPYIMLGENLAFDFSDTAGLVAAWMDSPTHRENILNENFKDGGMGVALGDVSQGQYSVAVANTFGTQPQIAVPKTAAPSTTQQTPGTVTQTPAPSSKPRTSLKTHVQNTKPSQPIALVPEKSSEQTTAPTTSVQTPAQSGSAEQTINSAIDLSSIKLSAVAKDNMLALHVQLALTGSDANVAAAVETNGTALQKQGNIYAGTLVFAQSYDLSKHDLLITMEHQTPIDLALKNLPITQAQTGNALPAGTPSSAKNSPDVYNIFKYVVIIFGILFVFFISRDLIHNLKNKKDAFASHGSNIIIIILLLGTALLVSFWH